jgi:8-oxo-dGTP pyrophosphatase MutT (NUDIX family)
VDLTPLNIENVAKARPVRPRDAASLILVRDGVEVLMGRRRSRTRFVPGYYVFPGGTVDASDRLAQPASALKPETIHMLGMDGDEDKARALAMAAVRETYEETGLILGESGEVGPVDSESWAALRRLQLAPALGRLSYVGRAITPSFSPIRFHARFFMADARFTHGSLRHGGELVDLRWVSLANAKRLAIIDVTEFMLDYVAELLKASAKVRVGRPLFAYRNDIPYVRYVGGPAPEGIDVVKDRSGLK